MRQYKDPRGGLTIDKTESVQRDEKKENRTRRKEVSNKDVGADVLIDTLCSYQQAIFTNNPTENGGSECLLCGKKTSYDNRHVCSDCWKIYKDEIVTGLKDALSDTDIRIE